MPRHTPQLLLTTLLWHTTSAGAHYDWLLQNPLTQGVENAGLTTFRVPVPPCLWLAQPNWPLTPLDPHRKIYLTYEGPVSSGRGFVLQADTGTFTPIAWTGSLITLDIRWRLAGHTRCTLAEAGSGQWTLSTITPTAAPDA